MATGIRAGAISYREMVEYVATVTDPLEAHMDAHDVWHRDQLTIAQRADRAARLALLSNWVAIAALVASVVLAVWLRH